MSRGGIRTSAAANAALSRPQEQKGYGLRPACSNRGFCQAGCSTGAEASLDVSSREDSSSEISRLTLPIQVLANLRGAQATAVRGCGNLMPLEAPQHILAVIAGHSPFMGKSSERRTRNSESLL